MTSPRPVLRSLSPWLLAWLLVVAHGAPLAAQAGDAKDPHGNPTADLPPDLIVPAAPALSPSQALAGFALPDDLTIELVAAEPLVVDPVAAVFDGDGSLWVVEMRGYMPDVDGNDELEPVGAVARLHDDDGDGTMDRRDDFLSGLVLPRALVPTRGGVLVIAPPDLLFCRDNDGDGVADERRVVDTGLAGLHSPEHAVNSLTYTLDNAFAVANLGRRWRWQGDELVSSSVVGGGQWGLTQDVRGRLFFNTNSDALRGHAVPPSYAARHPEQGRLSGIDRRVAQDQAVFPSRITPGVNRGYQPATLKDWRLVRTTAVCGPLVHLGDGLPAPYRGDAFVCEPAANLVKRYTLEDDGRGLPVATAVADELDWLTSTDERFRPVNLVDGPDGALYVVDLYRGILQHKIFMTTYLRKQVLARGLDTPVGLGRIWRVRAADGRRPAPAPLSALTPEQQVARLSHPNGHLRLAAQQRLVEAGPGRAPLDALRAALRDAPTPEGRLHALWTLQGLGQPDDLHTHGALDGELLGAALADDSAVVREAALRLAGPGLSGPFYKLAPAVAARARDGTGGERTAALLALGDLTSDAQAAARLAGVAPAVVGEAHWRSALINGLAGRGAAFLTQLEAQLDAQTNAPLDPQADAQAEAQADAQPDTQLGPDSEYSHPAPDTHPATAGAPADGYAQLFSEVARAVGRGRRSSEVDAILTLAAEGEPWQARALLAGLVDARPHGHDGNPGRLPLATEPAQLERLLASADETTATLAGSLHAALWWPGHAVPDPSRDLRPLSPDELARFERGRGLYATACTPCHQPSGKGAPGLAPPLVGSPWALGSPRRVAAILVHGLSGPLEVHGVPWDMDMPALAGDDAYLAAVLTYVRREWGNGAEPISAAQVAEVRAATAERAEPFSVEELLALDP